MKNNNPLSRIIALIMIMLVISPNIIAWSDNMNDYLDELDLDSWVEDPPEIPETSTPQKPGLIKIPMMPPIPGMPIDIGIITVKPPQGKDDLPEWWFEVGNQKIGLPSVKRDESGRIVPQKINSKEELLQILNKPIPEKIEFPEQSLRYELQDSYTLKPTVNVKPLSEIILEEYFKQGYSEQLGMNFAQFYDQKVEEIEESEELSREEEVMTKYFYCFDSELTDEERSIISKILDEQPELMDEFYSTRMDHIREVATTDLEQQIKDGKITLELQDPSLSAELQKAAAETLFSTMTGMIGTTPIGSSFSAAIESTQKATEETDEEKTKQAIEDIKSNLNDITSALNQFNQKTQVNKDALNKFTNEHGNLMQLPGRLLASMSGMWGTQEVVTTRTADSVGLMVDDLITKVDNKMERNNEIIQRIDNLKEKLTQELLTEETIEEINNGINEIYEDFNDVYRGNSINQFQTQLQEQLTDQADALKTGVWNTKLITNAWSSTFNILGAGGAPVPTLEPSFLKEIEAKYSAENIETLTLAKTGGDIFETLKDIRTNDIEAYKFIATSSTRNDFINNKFNPYKVMTTFGGLGGMDIGAIGMSEAAEIGSGISNSIIKYSPSIGSVYSDVVTIMENVHNFDYEQLDPKSATKTFFDHFADLPNIQQQRLEIAEAKIQERDDIINNLKESELGEYTGDELESGKINFGKILDEYDNLMEWSRETDDELSRGIRENIAGEFYNRMDKILQDNLGISIQDIESIIQNRDQNFDIFGYNILPTTLTLIQTEIVENENLKVIDEMIYNNNLLGALVENTEGEQADNYALQLLERENLLEKNKWKIAVQNQKKSEIQNFLTAKEIERDLGGPGFAQIADKKDYEELQYKYDQQQRSLPDLQMEQEANNARISQIEQEIIDLKQGQGDPHKRGLEILQKQELLKEEQEKRVVINALVQDKTKIEEIELKIQQGTASDEEQAMLRTMKNEQGNALNRWQAVNVMQMEMYERQVQDHQAEILGMQLEDIGKDITSTLQSGDLSGETGVYSIEGLKTKEEAEQAQAAAFANKLAYARNLKGMVDGGVMRYIGVNVESDGSLKGVGGFKSLFTGDGRSWAQFVNLNGLSSQGDMSAWKAGKAIFGNTREYNQEYFEASREFGQELVALETVAELLKTGITMNEIENMNEQGFRKAMSEKMGEVNNEALQIMWQDVQKARNSDIFQSSTLFENDDGTYTVLELPTDINPLNEQADKLTDHWLGSLLAPNIKTSVVMWGASGVIGGVTKLAGGALGKATAYLSNKAVSKSAHWLTKLVSKVGATGLKLGGKVIKGVGYGYEMTNKVGESLNKFLTAKLIGKTVKTTGQKIIKIGINILEHEVSELFLEEALLGPAYGVIGEELSGTKGIGGHEWGDAVETLYGGRAGGLNINTNNYFTSQGQIMNYQTIQGDVMSFVNEMNNYYKQKGMDTIEVVNTHDTTFGVEAVEVRLQSGQKMTIASQGSAYDAGITNNRMSTSNIGVDINGNTIAIVNVNNNANLNEILTSLQNNPNVDSSAIKTQTNILGGITAIEFQDGATTKVIKTEVATLDHYTDAAGSQVEIKQTTTLEDAVHDAVEEIISDEDISQEQRKRYWGILTTDAAEFVNVPAFFKQFTPEQIKQEIADDILSTLKHEPPTVAFAKLQEYGLMDAQLNAKTTNPIIQDYVKKVKPTVQTFEQKRKNLMEKLRTQRTKLESSIEQTIDQLKEKLATTQDNHEKGMLQSAINALQAQVHGLQELSLETQVANLLRKMATTNDDAEFNELQDLLQKKQGILDQKRIDKINKLADALVQQSIALAQQQTLENIDKLAEDMRQTAREKAEDLTKVESVIIQARLNFLLRAGRYSDIQNMAEDAKITQEGKDYLEKTNILDAYAALANVLEGNTDIKTLNNLIQTLQAQRVKVIDQDFLEFGYDYGYDINQLIGMIETAKTNIRTKRGDMVIQNKIDTIRDAEGTFKSTDDLVALGVVNEMIRIGYSYSDIAEVMNKPQSLADLFDITPEQAQKIADNYLNIMAEIEFSKVNPKLTSEDLFKKSDARSQSAQWQSIKQATGVGEPGVVNTQTKTPAQNIIDLIKSHVDFEGSDINIEDYISEVTKLLTGSDDFEALSQEQQEQVYREMKNLIERYSQVAVQGNNLEVDTTQQGKEDAITSKVPFKISFSQFNRGLFDKGLWGFVDHLCNVQFEVLGYMEANCAG